MVRRAVLGRNRGRDKSRETEEIEEIEETDKSKKKDRDKLRSTLARKAKARKKKEIRNQRVSL
jgi:hypothetical protein